jgi:ferritin-like metal-binding protein YciE
MSNGKSGTATDTTYNLVSIVYHALQAVDSYHGYRRDAEEAGDSEVTSLIDQAISQQQNLAQQARKLLAQRLSQESGS